MWKSIILLGLLLTACRPAITTVEPNLYTINPDKVMKMMAFLASDDLKGRKTGTEGINRAAMYIEETFSKNGIKPFFETYRDSFKVNTLDGFNIIGYIEGRDDLLKKEVIIVSAHYDHIGLIQAVNNDSIANGANDNASGSVATVLLANYFAQAKTNKRSLMFVLFSGEEMGLTGSEHLAIKLKEHHIDLYTMINFEMIGVPFKDRDYDAFISGYDLSNMASQINKYAGSNWIGKSELAIKYNLFKRSDNFPFFRSFGVPCQSISSCDLTNYNFYHHVDDEIEKMDFEHMSDLINKIIPAIETMSATPDKEIKMTKSE